MPELINNEIFLVDEPVAFGFYPDGQPVVDWSQIGYRPYRMNLRSSSVDALMCAMWIADAWAERGYPINTLVVPCLPGARQDRLSQQGDFLFGAKSVAREINMRNFARVICYDAHSDVMPGLIDRCIALEPAAAVECGLVTFENPISFVIAPDAGAAKRASKVAKVLGVPVVQAWKTRDPQTNKLAGFGIEDITTLARGSAQRGLVVDDICDGGWTFVGLGDYIKTRWPQVDIQLYVSHGYFAKGLDQLKAVYSKAYTTNTTNAAIGINDPWLTVADLTQLFNEKVH